MTAPVIRRRLYLIEILLVIAVFSVFYLVTNFKNLGYAGGVVAGIGIFALAFFRPRYGLIGVMVLLFTESTIGSLNALADAAREYELTGIPSLIQTQWFGGGVLILYVIFLLSYIAREMVSNRKLRPLSALEWILLMPLLMALTYLPISLIYGNLLSNFFYDIIPLLLYAGIVVLARVFYQPGKTNESRYFYLDWFLFFNTIILIPLWGYNIIFNTFRNGYVGIESIRYGSGPYDFNFFLAPLLGMILIHDDNLGLARKRFYQFGFVASLARVFISLFRGAIGGTFIALVIATFLIDKVLRRKWGRSLLVFIGSLFLILALGCVAVPVVRTTVTVALAVRVMRMFGMVGGVDSSIQFRELETETAWDEIMDRPIIGYGPGKLVVKNFNTEDFARVELYLHSAYIWFWYKLGILGLGVIIVFFGGIYAVCGSLLKRKMYPADRGWVIGTLSAMIAMLPVIHTNNMLIRSQGAYALTLLLFGLVMIVLRYQGVPRDALPPPEHSEIPQSSITEEAEV
ncbi:MAG: O-antigen ligase family protein [bacterium]|nr:O-antigen ligase family protein [bacterium]